MSGRAGRSARRRPGSRDEPGGAWTSGAVALAGRSPRSSRASAAGRRHPRPTPSAPPSPTAAAASPSAPPAATPGVGDPPVASIRRGRRRPGRRPARDICLGRRRVVEPVAAGRADRRRGAEETADRTLGPAVVVTAWTARIAPAADQDGSQAVVIASGDGPAGPGRPEARVVDPGRDGDASARSVRRPTPGGWTCPDRRSRRVRQAVVTAGSGEAEKIETWASSGSITPRTFWSVRRWTHEDQLSK